MQDELDRVSKFIGSSAAAKIIQAQLVALSASEEAVLIRGETGTGKKLVAHILHQSSRRKAELFLPLTTSAALELVSWPSVISNEANELSIAADGTLFVADIDQLSLPMQNRLTELCVSANVRLLASAQTTGTRETTPGLHSNAISLPTLEERREDIPELAYYFLRELNGRYGRAIEAVESDAMHMLRYRSWPGNVRQLRNVIEAAYVLSSGRTIRAADVDLLPWPDSA